MVDLHFGAGLYPAAEVDDQTGIGVFEDPGLDLAAVSGPEVDLGQVPGQDVLPVVAAIAVVIGLTEAEQVP